MKKFLTYHGNGKKVKNKNVKPEGYEGREEFANRQAWKFLRDDEIGALQA